MLEGQQDEKRGEEGSVNGSVNNTFSNLNMLYQRLPAIAAHIRKHSVPDGSGHSRMLTFLLPVALPLHAAEIFSPHVYVHAPLRRETAWYLGNARPSDDFLGFNGDTGQEHFHHVVYKYMYGVGYAPNVPNRS